ncbi:WD40 repeat and RING finger domain-containing protein [Cryptosporidium felis]|nr:WD40 repeat and RING finger domain-containing protein [Cryptosporidium felis]
MLQSVDVDISGNFGISCGKGVFIHDLRIWKRQLEDQLEFSEIEEGRKLIIDNIIDNGSYFDTIYMDYQTNLNFGDTDIVKFGTHPKVKDNFIVVHRNSMFHGTLDGMELEFISNQMMNITSFDWSPHFSTGTFVTSSEDALIRVSDIRSKSINFSFMSFYNTSNIKWNPLNSHLLGALQEKGAFISVYDLRMLKSIGIIPRQIWSDKNSSGQKREVLDISWLPLSSNKLLICESGLLTVLDITMALGSTEMVSNQNCGFKTSEMIQHIGFKGSEFSSGFELLNFSSSSFEDEQAEDEDPSESADNKSSEIKSQVSYPKINTFDFISGTNNLIAGDNKGRFYYCNIEEYEDLSLNKSKVRFFGSVERVFTRGSEGWILFGHSNQCARIMSKIHNKTSNQILKPRIKPNFFASKKRRPPSEFQESSLKLDDGILSCKLKDFCLKWFYKDLISLSEKVKTSQQIANNLVSVTIETGEVIFAGLSRHPTIRGKFQIDDNSHSITALESFDFTITLTSSMEPHKILKATYFITKNTLHIFNQAQLCRQNNPEYAEKSFSSDEYILRSENRARFSGKCMQCKLLNPVPLRIYVDNIILEGDDMKKICGFFEILKLEEGKGSEETSVLDWDRLILGWEELVMAALHGFGKVSENLHIKEQPFPSEFTKETISDPTKEKFESSELGGKNGPSYTFNTLDRLVLSSGNHLIMMRMNDEYGLRSERYENIVLEINKMLAKLHKMSESKFIYGDFVGYSYALLNWLTGMLYKQARKHGVQDIRHFSFDPKRVSDTGSLQEMVLSPTSLHSYFRNLKESHSSRSQEEIWDPETSTNYIRGVISPTIEVEGQIDKKKLMLLLKRLYLEIKNNYDARILILAIQKLSNHLERSRGRRPVRQENDPYLICYVCSEPVFAIYSRCPKCKHGGHIKHIQIWFDSKQRCPAVGCDCQCVQRT